MVKPTLVLLPGFDGSGRLFSPLRKSLADSVNTIILSYPSDKVMTYYDLCHFLKDELPDTPYVILGESFGGPLAMMLSKHANQNLKGIILCVSFIKNPHVLFTKFVRPFLKPKHLQKETPATWIKAMLTNGVSNAKLIKNIQAATRELTREVYFYRLREIADVDVTKVLQECEVPVLYLRAKNDRLVYEGSMKWIQSKGKNVTVEEFKAPHMLLQTKPEQAAKCILSFIDNNIVM